MGGFEVTEEGKQVIDDFCKKKSMHKKDAVARILNWFALQRPIVQSVIVGLVDEDLNAAAADVLEHMARDLRGHAGNQERASRRKMGGA